MISDKEEKLLKKYFLENFKNWKANKNGNVVLDIDDLLELNRFKRWLGILSRNPFNFNRNVKIKNIDAKSVKEAWGYIYALIGFFNRLIEIQNKQQSDTNRIVTYYNSFRGGEDDKRQ